MLLRRRRRGSKDGFWWVLILRPGGQVFLLLPYIVSSLTSLPDEKHRSLPRVQSISRKRDKVEGCVPIIVAVGVFVALGRRTPMRGTTCTSSVVQQGLLIRLPRLRACLFLLSKIPCSGTS
jgi:hypothetical protein